MLLTANFLTRYDQTPNYAVEKSHGASLTL